MADLKQHTELLAWLAEAREAYAEMGASGHAGLGGFCISIANRFDKASESIFNPPQAKPESTQTQPDDMQPDCA